MNNIPQEIHELILNFLTNEEKLGIVSSCNSYHRKITIDDVRLATVVVRYGTLESLGWYITSPINSTTWCIAAADNGQLEHLGYAHEHGCEWNSDTCTHAAMNGHLDCLRYAHEHGCEWTGKTWKNALYHGHLDCLKYAHENGCKWGSYPYNINVSLRNLKCVEYAIENGCRITIRTAASLAKIRSELS